MPPPIYCDQTRCEYFVRSSDASRVIGTQAVPKIKSLPMRITLCLLNYRPLVIGAQHQGRQALIAMKLTEQIYKLLLKCYNIASRL